MTNPEGVVVKNKNQAREFIEVYLRPAADMLAGTDFEDSPLEKVDRIQSFHFGGDEPTWNVIGFSATKMFLEDDEHETLYNVWVSSSLSTDEVPFTSVAERISVLHRDKINNMLGGIAVVNNPEDSDEDDDEIEGFEREVEEFRDFYLSTGKLVTKNDLDYVFREDGEILDVVDGKTPAPVDFEMVTDNQDANIDLQVLDSSMNEELEAEDTAVILGILGRLGLLKA